jgi:hypothetical protein
MIWLTNVRPNAAKEPLMTNHPTAGAEETRPAPEQLGTLLVKRGLITAEQLTAALADQQASGEPLGKIVVARGFVSPAMVAQALATQHGGLLKTEYGFATGFGSASGSPVAMLSAPPVTQRVIGRPAAEKPAAVAAPAVPTAPDADSLRDEIAHASAETERLRDDNERLAQLRGELEQRLAAESQRAAALERELASAKEAAPASDGEERIAALEAEVASRDAAIADFKQTGESWKAALAERDDAIRDLVAARDEALARVNAAQNDSAEASVPEAELQALKAEHEAKLAELAAARDEVLMQLRATKAELASREAKLPEIVAARDAVAAELEQAKASLAGHDTAMANLIAEHEAALAEAAAAAPAAVTDRWAAAERHLLFFQGSEGYELVERSGPPPAAGDRVEVPGQVCLVTRIAASPAPGPRLPCAYLIAA